MNGGQECGKPFVNNISNYINELSLIGDLSAELDEMAFPIALCDYIDQGKNPDLQMKQNYMVTQTKNNLQRSRIVNTHSLHQYLENGQKYFKQWSQEKNKCINNNNNKNMNECINHNTKPKSVKQRAQDPITHNERMKIV
mmetsp:Transcript_65172/g.58487  ORF Transcript_65172/g.58487 Transcript_65172/m.58487 type:complete len:140 (-) Transcript_65172:103-522(-)